MKVLYSNVISSCSIVVSSCFSPLGLVVTSKDLKRSGDIWVCPNSDHVCTRFFFVYDDYSNCGSSNMDTRSPKHKAEVDHAVAHIHSFKKPTKKKKKWQHFIAAIIVINFMLCVVFLLIFKTIILQNYFPGVKRTLHPAPLISTLNACMDQTKDWACKTIVLPLSGGLV